MQGCHKSLSDWYTAHTIVYISVVVIIVSLQVVCVFLLFFVPSSVNQN